MPYIEVFEWAYYFDLEWARKLKDIAGLFGSGENPKSQIRNPKSDDRLLAEKMFGLAVSGGAGNSKLGFKKVKVNKEEYERRKKKI